MRGKYKMSVYLNVFQRSGKIYERYLDENLIEHQRIITDFSPSLFVENANVDSKYKSIYGVNCIRRNFNTISEALKVTKDSSFKMLGQDDYALQYISHISR